MTALPTSGLAGVVGAGTAALVVSGRRTPAEARLQAAARGFGSCVVIRGRGRRSGAAEDLVAEVLRAGVTTVIVSSLTVLHPQAANALAIAGALMMSGVRLVSLNDGGWLASADEETVAGIAAFLLADQQQRASAHGRKAIALVRRTGVRVGRPSLPLPIPAEEALRLVKARGWRGAAKAIGISAASIRRALSRAGLLEPQSSTGRSP